MLCNKVLHRLVSKFRVFFSPQLQSKVILINFEGRRNCHTSTFPQKVKAPLVSVVYLKNLKISLIRACWNCFPASTKRHARDGSVPSLSCWYRINVSSHFERCRENVFPSTTDPQSCLDTLHTTRSPYTMHPKNEKQGETFQGPIHQASTDRWSVAT